jgi:hypothetical protein
VVLRRDSGSLRARGATEEDFKELSFASLVIETVFKKHAGEFRADPKFAEDILLSHLETTSPNQLRQYAATYRQKGNLEIAYLLEQGADQRERGKFGESDS